MRIRESVHRCCAAKFDRFPNYYYVSCSGYSELLHVMCNQIGHSLCGLDMKNHEGTSERGLEIRDVPH